MEVRMLGTATIKPYEKNAKKHPAEQVARIARSLEEFGWQQPLVVDRNNVLVIGHGRLQAAKKLGMKEVPVVRADSLTDEQIKALRLADNRTAESDWDIALMNEELGEILDIDMGDFGFDLNLGGDDGEDDFDGIIDPRAPAAQHNVFENQDRMQFPCTSFYGMPEIQPTQTVGDKLLRFMDWKECDNPGEYIAHFFYDDYKFINAWREPDKYIDRLRQFKAVISPDFSVYTDFPRALQILACYRRQWCGAFWQSLGIDVIPDVRWGDRDSYDYCFDGIPKGGTVAISALGIANDRDWNEKDDDLWMSGYEEMLKRLEPTTIIYYGTVIGELAGNVIRVPSYYEAKFVTGKENANGRKRKPDGQR